MLTWGPAANSWRRLACSWTTQVATTHWASVDRCRAEFRPLDRGVRLAGHHRTWTALDLEPPRPRFSRPAAFSASRSPNASTSTPHFYEPGSPELPPAAHRSLRNHGDAQVLRWQWLETHHGELRQPPRAALTGAPGACANSSADSNRDRAHLIRLLPHRDPPGTHAGSCCRPTSPRPDVADQVWHTNDASIHGPHQTAPPRHTGSCRRTADASWSEDHVTAPTGRRVRHAHPRRLHARSRRDARQTQWRTGPPPGSGRHAVSRGSLPRRPSADTIGVQQVSQLSGAPLVGAGRARTQPGGAPRPY